MGSEEDAPQKTAWPHPIQPANPQHDPLMSSPHDLQVRKVLQVAPVSRSLAAAIAVLAFSSGRQR